MFGSELPVVTPKRLMSAPDRIAAHAATRLEAQGAR